jgi:branched-chain amino acid transport system permease protein
MESSFYLIQLLNAVQYGFLLFLVASGLTLLFGIMGIINLAHGSFYMIGAYLAYWLSGVTGSLWLGIMLALPIAILVGYLVERSAISFLYKRDHLYQVLLTFALILIFNELQQILWGTDVHSVPIPAILSGSLQMTENQSYPVYRLFISAACIAIAGGMYWVIQKTRLGMMIRAGANNREMVQALGIDVNRLFAIVFSLGVALAAFAGMLAAPVDSVYPGMGENVLIISFVVVVIIGLVSTFGKVLLPEQASIMAYALMVGILLWRPQGLFGMAN